VAFTPWITADGYRGLLAFLEELDLVDQVAPIQLGIRLLVPAGSRLLELPELWEMLGPFDPAAMIYPWRHPDLAVDLLYDRIQRIIRDATTQGASRREIFQQAWRAAGGRARGSLSPPRSAIGFRHSPVPYLTEPWYC
jgi:hypothetical protein